ncbi:MAG: LysE family transporter [Verrucomicrobiota bacterium]|nr:LysE family transporter [Verrucomicrobiota bacterium]
MFLFLQGLLFGFIVAAPIGPIGALCIQKTLRSGKFAGLCAGLGAATADLLYAVTAAFGFSLLSDFFLNEHVWIRIAGGAFLCYFGVKTLISPLPTSHHSGNSSPLAAFLSTFFLTLASPLTILAFFALFASFNVSHLEGESNTRIVFLFLGVFLGSSFWGVLLSEGIHFFRKRAGAPLLHWIHRIVGAVLLTFGLLTWISLLFN